MNKLSIKNRPLVKRAGVSVAAIALLSTTFFLGVTYGKNDGISLNQTARLNSENSSLPADLNYNSVDAVYDSLKNNYDGKLTQEQLLNGLKTGLAAATDDPYTQYFNPDDAKVLNEQLTGTFSGIGAQLGKDDNGNLQIIAPISGTPAAEAGLQAGDLITKINGESTTNLEVDIAVTKIRGQAGSQVKLEIVRSGEVKDYTITRANISVPTVESKILDGNIGYIKVSQFTDDNASGEGTAALARKAAEDFKSKNVTGIVLDLRSNPGGTVNSAVGLTSLWLDQGQTVFQEKRGGQVNRTYAATGNNILKGIPTTVLIDGGSASASEITAGTLKDTNAATIIGQKSYGKGSVQTVINLANGSELKVTIGRWFRPNGDNIDKKGITPDQTVERSTEGDAQLDAAVAKLKS